MRTEIPKPVGIAVIVLLVVAIVAFGYFYFNRGEVYQPSSGGASGQTQQLRPMVPGQDGSPQNAPQGNGTVQIQPF